jgi:hypothetical protein
MTAWTRRNDGVQGGLFPALQPDRPDAGATWYDYFRARFFPRPTRGTAAENRAAASELVVIARRVAEDPEVAEILRLRYDLALAGLPMPEEAHEHGMDEDDLLDEYAERDLWGGSTYLPPSALVDLPPGTPAPRTAREAEDMAEAFLYFVLDLDHQGRLGVSRPPPHRAGKPVGERSAERREERAAAEVLLGQVPEPAPLALSAEEERLRALTARVQPIPMSEAHDFVRAHHSALAKPRKRGDYLALGLVYGGELAAVAVVSTPSGRDADQERIVDVSRVASDGTVRGASSALVRWVIEHAPELVRRRGARPLVVTYSLITEQGTTYKALERDGLRPVAVTRGTEATGARAGSDEGLKEMPKIRWEAGPDARPARPELLDLWRAALPVSQGRPLERRHLQPLDLEALAELPRVLQDIAPVEHPPNLRGLDKGAARSALVAAWGAR